MKHFIHLNYNLQYEAEDNTRGAFTGDRLTCKGTAGGFAGYRKTGKNGEP
jgi:hypothetical protein